MIVELMVFVFLLAYIAIALEHVVKVDKAATALAAGGILWILLTGIISDMHHYDVALLEHVSEIGALLFFLIGAMTIVEVVDVHDGFSVITSKITTKNKKVFLLIITLITFFMSAVLDNLTSSIVMVMLLRKLVRKRSDRLLFASMVILAANGGGAWSPIGDITTIMLWVKGAVTSTNLITHIFLPSVVSVAIPFFIISFMLKGKSLPHGLAKSDSSTPLLDAHGNAIISRATSKKEESFIFIMGVCCLLSIPIFKSLLGLPPFLSVLLALSILWISTELIYARKLNTDGVKNPVSKIISRIDLSTVLFFLGILLAVGALQVAGVLEALGEFIDKEIGNVYIINMVIGVLSSIVDNVPLVAGSIGMYNIVDPATVSSLPNPEYAKYFVQDGIFWSFLTYCAGVGGSIFIIGSAAGVVVMGLEKISFMWYLRKISLAAFLGFIGGALTYILQMYIINGTL